jgi:hypothetical protein
MITTERFIEVIERIKYLSEDVTELGWLEPATVKQIYQLCEDTIIDWKCENAKIGEMNETRT